jgi:signal peptidase II
MTSAKMSSPRRLFAITLLVTLVLDQVTKFWVYYGLDIAVNQPIDVTSFFDLVLVWNRGISYGLFQQSSEFGRWALTLFKLGAAIALSIWAWRVQEKWLSFGLGLIAGGALGNAMDRIHFGAVLDFAHFFWGNFSWYVFNIADAAIVVGVVVLMYDSFKPRPVEG